MIQHYFKVALRSMARQKLYATITIVGFAVGIAACLFISLYIRHETSFDRDNPHGDRVYRVIGEMKVDGNVKKSLSFPAPMAAALSHDFPQIEKVGRIMPNSLFGGAGSNQIRPVGREDNTYEKGFCFADPSIIDILNIPIIRGDRRHALTEPFTFVMSRRMAEKYFPHEDPIGKLFHFNQGGKLLKVSAVMENMPATSHLNYDFFISLAGVRFWDGEQESWGASNYGIYLLLKKGVSVEALQKQLTRDVLDNYFAPALTQAHFANVKQLLSRSRLTLQPLRAIHLHSYDIDEINSTSAAPLGDIRLVWIFSTVAVAILLLACVNFVNLATARAATRAREVGVRKVIGSARGELIRLFLCESVLYSVLSFLVALLLAQLLMPLFNRITGAALALPWRSPYFITGLPLAAVMVGLVAGAYPSLFLSAFQPAKVLKGGPRPGSSHAGLRRVLVVFQFTTSIVLIVGTLVIAKQLHYVLSGNAGFDRDQVLMIKGTGTMGDHTQTFKTELLALPEVKSVSVSDFLPVEGTKRDGNTFWKEGMARTEAGVMGQHWQVDRDYLTTLGVKLAEGRNFLPDPRSDSNAVLINETMAHKLGLQDPVGKMITNSWEHFRVIGVVKDFYFESMKKPIAPLLMALGGTSSDIVAVKVKGTDMNRTLAAVGTIWKRFMPHQGMRYDFLDESFGAMYRDVSRTSLLFTCFATIAIIIACLGLLGLVTYMAEQRRKEISIRKVLGASVASIFALLTGRFMRLIAVSLLIAFPASWWVMTGWLQDYTHRISISWDLFALAGLTVAVIALATICFQALRAAYSNPAVELRNE